ncbi:MAG: hypothetical protein LBK71_06250 [Verrucomicrobiales bacterium]|jgi:hypothetical protein|nr:hypothetical protein [Verrucomicrobiales bacterium]
MHKRISEALSIIKALGFPKEQRNERSALCLLAIGNITKKKNWCQAESPLLGITPIMNWIARHYQRQYQPNTRETVRRQTMHQFVSAGLAMFNPDVPDRPINSPKNVYQLSPSALNLVRACGRVEWENLLQEFLSKHTPLTERYARPRPMNQIAVCGPDGQAVKLSPGKHSALIKAVIEEFARRFAPGSEWIYVGDPGAKWSNFRCQRLKQLGVTVDAHGKMPDVVLYFAAKQWLLLVEAVTSHGPVDAKRRDELARLFTGAKAGIVYVTAFPDKKTLTRYLGKIAWETEVWVADAPSHLIHLNGEKFLRPYR